MPFVVDELTRAKLCLLYLFRAVALPLSRDAVILALDVLPWINQFILSEALSDLLESGLVLELNGQGRNTYEISQTPPENNTVFRPVSSTQWRILRHRTFPMERNSPRDNSPGSAPWRICR